MDLAQEVLRFTRNVFQAYKKASPALKRHYLGFFWERFEVEDGVIINSCLSPLFKELLRLEQATYNSEKPKKPIENNESSLVILNLPELPNPDLNSTGQVTTSHLEDISDEAAMQLGLILLAQIMEEHKRETK